MTVAHEAKSTPADVALESTHLVALAEGATGIQSHDDYEHAGRILTEDVKPWLKRVDSAFDPLIKEANAHTANLRAFKAQVREQGEQAEAGLKSAMLAWQEAEQARIAEEERKAAEAARKEQLRAAEAEAARLEASGDTESAAEVVAEAESTPAVAPAVERPKGPQGVATRTTWKGRVTDMKALVTAVSEGKVPMNALQVNQTAINQAAKAAKKDFNWPGCEAVATKTVSARAR